MLIHKSRCYNGGKRHKFRPRYSERPNSQAVKLRGTLAVLKTRSLMYYQEYLFDICEWCGKKITK